MRKIYSILMIAVVLLCSVNCHSISVREMILNYFSVDIGKLDYTILQKSEEWLPNGDGEYYLCLSLDNTPKSEVEFVVSQMLENGAQPLPLDPSIKNVRNKINDYKKANCRGLFIIQVDSTDNRNYSALILDEIARELVIEIEIF